MSTMRNIQPAVINHTQIKSVQVQHFNIPLDEVLNDAKHGDHTHFELVVCRIPCANGIGLTMAEGLAEAGADIVGVSASLAKSGSATEKAVLATGRKFTAYQADFSSRESLYSMINEVNENHDCIDILVNNAGSILRAPAAQHSDEYWDKIIEINLSRWNYRSGLRCQ